jgi:hypothetical protein
MFCDCLRLLVDALENCGLLFNHFTAKDIETNQIFLGVLSYQNGTTETVNTNQFNRKYSKKHSTSKCQNLYLPTARGTSATG